MADDVAGGNAPGSYTWEDFVEGLDLDAMTDLGNQWILLGDALYGGQKSFAGNVEAFEWTGATSTTAATTWTANMGPMIDNAADAAWTIGQSIHAYVDGIKQQADKMAEEANKQYFTMIFSFLLNVALLPLGFAASLIPMVARIIGSLVNVITQIGTKLGWLAATAAEFAVGAVVGGVTSFGIDMAALGLGAAAAGGDFHVDWEQTGVNIGVGAAFGGIIGGGHAWLSMHNKVPMVVPPPGIGRGGGTVPQYGSPSGSGGPGPGPGRGGSRQDGTGNVTPVTLKDTPLTIRGDGPGPADVRGPGGPPPKGTPEGGIGIPGKSAPVDKTNAVDPPSSAPVQRPGSQDRTLVGEFGRQGPESSVTPLPLLIRQDGSRPPNPSDGPNPASSRPAGGGSGVPVTAKLDQPGPVGSRPGSTDPLSGPGGAGRGGSDVPVTVKTDPPGSAPSRPAPSRPDSPAPSGRGDPDVLAPPKSRRPGPDSSHPASSTPEPLAVRPDRNGSPPPPGSEKPSSPLPSPSSSRAPSQVTSEPAPIPRQPGRDDAGSRGPGGDAPVFVRPADQDAPAPSPSPSKGGNGRGGFEMHVDIRRPAPDPGQASFPGPGRRIDGGDVPVEPPANRTGEPDPATSAPPDVQTTRVTLDFLPGKPGDAPPKPSTGSGTPGRQGGDEPPGVTVRVEKATGPEPGPPRSPFESEGRTLDGGVVPGRGEQSVPIRGVPQDGPGRVNVWMNGQEVKVGPGELGSSTYVVHPGVHKFSIADGEVKVHVGREQPAPSPSKGDRSPFDGEGRRLGDGRPVPAPETPAPSRGTDGTAPPPEPVRVEYGQPVTFTFGDRNGPAPQVGSRPSPGEGHTLGGGKPSNRGTPSEHAGQAAHDRSGAGNQGPLKSAPDTGRDGTTSGPATTEKPGRGGDTQTVLAKKPVRSPSPSSSSESGRAGGGGGGGAGHRPGASTIEVQPVRQRTPVSDDGTPVVQLDVGLPDPASAPAFARPINRGGPGESAFTGEGRPLGGPERSTSGPGGTGQKPGDVGGVRPSPSNGDTAGGSGGSGGGSAPGSREPSPSRPQTSSSSSSPSSLWTSDDSTTSSSSSRPASVAPGDENAGTPAGGDTPTGETSSSAAAPPHVWADGGGFEVRIDVRRPANAPGGRAGGGEPAGTRPETETTRITLDFVPAESSGTRANGGIADITVRVEEAQPPPDPPQRPFAGGGRTLDGGVVPARPEPTVPIHGLPQNTPGRTHVWHDGQVVPVEPGRFEDGTFIVHPNVRGFALTDGDVGVFVGVQRTGEATPETGERSPFDRPGRRMRDGRPVDPVTEAPPTDPPHVRQDVFESTPARPPRVQYGQPVTFTFNDPAPETPAAPTSPVEGRPLGGSQAPARGTPAEAAGQAAHDRAGAGEHGPLQSPPAERPGRTSSDPATARPPGGLPPAAPKRSGGPSSAPGAGGSGAAGGGTGHRPGGSTIEIQPVEQQAPPPPGNGTPVIRVDVGMPEETPAFVRPVNRGAPGESAFTGEGRPLGGTQNPPRETRPHTAPERPKTPAQNGPAQSTEPAQEGSVQSAQSSGSAPQVIVGTQKPPAPPKSPTTQGSSAQTSAGGTIRPVAPGRRIDPVQDAAVDREMLTDAADAAKDRQHALWNAYLQAQIDHEVGVESSNTGDRIDDLGTRLQIATFEEEAARAEAEAAALPPERPEPVENPTVVLTGDFDPASSTLFLDGRPRDVAETRRWIGRNTPYEQGDPVNVVVPRAARTNPAFTAFAEDLATSLGGPVRIVRNPATGAGPIISPRRETPQTEMPPDVTSPSAPASLPSGSAPTDVPGTQPAEKPADPAAARRGYGGAVPTIIVSPPPGTTAYPEAATPELADYFVRQDAANAAWRTWGELAADLEAALQEQASGTGGPYIDAEVNALQDQVTEAAIDARLADIGAAIAADRATEAQIRRHGPGSTAAPDAGATRRPPAQHTSGAEAKEPGEGVLVVQGEFDHAAGTLTVEGRPLDLDGTTAWINRNPDYTSGTPVTLMTPEAGTAGPAGGPSFADGLAVRLGADVLVVDPSTGDGVLHVPPLQAPPETTTGGPVTPEPAERSPIVAPPETIAAGPVLPGSVWTPVVDEPATDTPVVPEAAEPSPVQAPPGTTANVTGTPETAQAPPGGPPPQEAPPRRPPWYVDVSAMGEATIERVDRWDDRTVQDWAGQVGNAVRRFGDGPQLAAGIRRGLEGVLANEERPDNDVSKWQSLFQDGRTFVVDGHLVWVRPVLQDASVGAQPTGDVRKYKVSFASMMSGGKTGGESTHGIDGMILAFFGVGTGAAATLISGLPTFTASSSTKADQGHDRVLIAGRKLFVADSARFDSGMAIKIFVDGVERANDVRLPQRFGVDFPEPLTSPDEPRPLQGTAAQGTAAQSTETQGTAAGGAGVQRPSPASEVINAVDTVPVVAELQRQLLTAGLPPASVKEVMDEIGGHISERSVRNRSRLVLGNGVPTAKVTVGAGSLKRFNGHFAISANVESLQYIGDTVMSIREDSGGGVTSKPTKEGKSKASIGYTVTYYGNTGEDGSSGGHHAGDGDRGLFRGGLSVPFSRTAGHGLAEQALGHAVLNRGGPQSRYRVGLRLNVDTRSPTHDVPRATALVEAEISVPRAEAAGFEASMTGAVRTPALRPGAAGQAQGQARQPGPRIPALPPAADAMPPAAAYERPRGLDRPVAVDPAHREPLPLATRRGIGFGMQSLLPGAELVHDQVRAVIANREAALPNAARTDWSQADLDLATWFSRPALEADLPTVMAGIDRTITVGGRRYNVSVQGFLRERTGGDSYTMTVNGRAMTAAGNTGHRNTEIGVQVNGGGGVRIGRLPYMRFILGAWSVQGEYAHTVKNEFGGTAKSYRRTETTGTVDEHNYNIVYQVTVGPEGGTATSWWIDRPGEVTARIVVPHEHLPAAPYTPEELQNAGNTVTSDRMPAVETVGFAAGGTSGVYPAFSVIPELPRLAAEMYARANGLPDGWLADPSGWPPAIRQMTRPFGVLLEPGGRHGPDRGPATDPEGTQTGDHDQGARRAAASRGRERDRDRAVRAGAADPQARHRAQVQGHARLQRRSAVPSRVGAGRAFGHLGRRHRRRSPRAGRPRPAQHPERGLRRAQVGAGDPARQHRHHARDLRRHRPHVPDRPGVRDHAAPVAGEPAPSAHPVPAGDGRDADDGPGAAHARSGTDRARRGPARPRRADAVRPAGYDRGSLVSGDPDHRGPHPADHGLAPQARHRPRLLPRRAPSEPGHAGDRRGVLPRGAAQPAQRPARLRRPALDPDPAAVRRDALRVDPRLGAARDADRATRPSRGEADAPR
ncbi:hypothetical protein [Actinomadura algeriensis]|uniref:Uncharacterized protein n=1 Tax=Actinomadura algeriensis TaxID=1679523 RepID=A0ABR9JTU6_9ACTN|nr:hypothetical protein [Actinomadura algeriensis]MBE1533995.1 hypothetical protein [Actinomadura algeriensis]